MNELAKRAYEGSRWDDAFWSKDGRRVHIPVDKETNSVQVSLEALEGLLTEAGYVREGAP